jgi:hypothetical protein
MSSSVAPIRAIPQSMRSGVAGLAQESDVLHPYALQRRIGVGVGYQVSLQQKYLQRLVHLVGIEAHVKVIVLVAFPAIDAAPETALQFCVLVVCHDGPARFPATQGLALPPG